MNKTSLKRRETNQALFGGLVVRIEVLGNLLNKNLPFLVLLYVLVRMVVRYGADDGLLGFA